MVWPDVADDFLYLTCLLIGRISCCFRYQTKGALEPTNLRPAAKFFTAGRKFSPDATPQQMPDIANRAFHQRILMADLHFAD